MAVLVVHALSSPERGPATPAPLQAAAIRASDARRLEAAPSPEVARSGELVCTTALVVVIHILTIDACRESYGAMRHPHL
jgi:hypothetical protein